jgi:hypothetical protein
VDERQRRIGENEALFRHVNERVKDVNRSFSLVLERGDYLCECGNQSCVERIGLTSEEYEGIRADPTHFVVKPGHVAPDVEEVVGAADTYEIVRKREGGPADLARETDPRG